MKIEKFVPPCIEYNTEGLDILLKDKNFIYASRGRWALYHCLISLGIEGNILVPAYVCSSILIPIKLLGLTPVFYDHRLDNLNPDIESIRKLIEKNHISACIVVSMYGLPADLLQIESLLKKYNILMIDDAAQAFGSKISDRSVGTFGDAGFFSFSPGKPTVAHMGAFFWTKNDTYTIKYTNHKLLHWLIYFDFYFNRLNIYTFKKYKLFKLFNIVRVFFKLIDIKNDDIEEFEKPILGGVLKDMFSNSFKYRNYWFNKIKKLFDEHKSNFRLIKNSNGHENPHKIVIIADSELLASQLLNYMNDTSIYAQKGYDILTTNLNDLPNLSQLSNHIVELPIDPISSNMEFMYKQLIFFWR